MSDEQLVRMGRTDLYRRGDTEIVNGRRVAKPGEDAVTVLTTTLNDSHSCAYQHRGTLWFAKPNGVFISDDIEHALDLVAIDPAPKLVPWEFSEIPVDHWFKHKDGGWKAKVTATCDVDSTVRLDIGWYGIRDLLDGFEHSTTHQGPFEPCGKYS